jgi:hypothetical protein
MINLTITVENINEVLNLFDRVELLKYTGSGAPNTPVDLNDYSSINGIDHTSDRTNVSDVILISNNDRYLFTDVDGVDDDWYISRYVNTTTSGTTGWSDPVKGESGDLFYDPTYPPEVVYGTEDKRVINRIRLLIGDPLGLNREYGPEALESLHPGNKVYELDENGWPASINMYGVQYTSKIDPSVNGYRYLKFQNPIDTVPVTVSGVEYDIDIWYYTFRKSDRQIMYVYDNVTPPPPLNTTNCTPEIYMLQAAYDILSNETWESINEDGALIKDEGSTYDPSPGLDTRADILAQLRKRLDDAIKSVKLLGITGVRVD